MLSGPMRAAIRRTVGVTLTQRCDIERESDARGSAGQPLHTWVSAQSDVPCRLIKPGQSQTSAGQIVGTQETLEDLYKLIIPITVELSVDQRVVIDGITYNIIRLETQLTDDVFHSALITRRL